MLSHVTIGTNDFPKARAFYMAVTEALGFRVLFENAQPAFITFSDQEKSRPWVFLTSPENGKPQTVGNGQMNAFLAPDRKSVDAGFAAAMANGGTSEGDPGLRLHYHPDFYAAYVRDPDGNKLCFVCHTPEA